MLQCTLVVKSWSPAARRSKHSLRPSSAAASKLLSSSQPSPSPPSTPPHLRPPPHLRRGAPRPAPPRPPRPPPATYTGRPRPCRASLAVSGSSPARPPPAPGPPRRPCQTPAAAVRLISRLPSRPASLRSACRAASPRPPTSALSPCRQRTLPVLDSPLMNTTTVAVPAPRPQAA
jgi:hypothetical protein